VVERHCDFNARSPGLALRKVQVRRAVFAEWKSSHVRFRVGVIDLSKLMSFWTIISHSGSLQTSDGYMSSLQ
jgi:hypothetical protein